MKQRIAHWGLLFISLITFSATLQAEPETLILDNHHTYIAWNIKHLGFSTQTGKWYATGQLVIDKEHPENSKVVANINVADIVTGIPELDKHLKSKLFFDVDHFPKATFVSDKVKVTGENKADVSGVLTLHGVSKPVVLHVIFNKAGMNPVNNKMTAGFTATATIKRSDFGINTLLPALGDEVELNINAEAYQDKKAG
ncbi:MAG: YceI family protein [Legionella sp.]|uniref:YceI family protein n=1 Tax=Legionella sp. TaxID=459 RepID=UPI0028512499|nr:YceI family protein [Legionella sp.]